MIKIVTRGDLKLSLKRKPSINLMKKSHLSSNLVSVKSTKLNQAEQGMETLKDLENVRNQAAQVTLAAKDQDMGVDEIINGVFTTREMVRLITKSTT